MARKRNKNIITGSIIILTLTTLIILTLSSAPLDKTTIPSKFVLAENTGFDLTLGKLNFGAMTSNSKSTRQITIENNFDEPVTITIKSSGAISPHIIVSENNFHLNQDESKNITFTAFTAGLTEFKEYTGQIEIITKKA